MSNFFQNAINVVKKAVRWISYALVLFVVLSIGYCSAERILRRNLAAEMIAIALRHDGVFEASVLGEKVCFIPEGYVCAGCQAKRLFPGKTVSYVETDESSGYWFIALVPYGKKEIVEVYAISQSVIFWDTPKSKEFRSAQHCPNVVSLAKYDGLWHYNRMESSK